MRSVFTKSSAVRIPAAGVIVAAAGRIGLADPASAAQVLIDVGGGAGGVDTVGRTWTNVNPDTDTNIGTGVSTPYNLLLTTGVDSGYDLLISNPPGTTGAGSPNNGFSG